MVGVSGLQVSGCAQVASELSRRCHNHPAALLLSQPHLPPATPHPPRQHIIVALVAGRLLDQAAHVLDESPNLHSCEGGEPMRTVVSGAPSPAMQDKLLGTIEDEGSLHCSSAAATWQSASRVIYPPRPPLAKPPSPVPAIALRAPPWVGVQH